jgi:hypothetical protein
MNILFLDLDGPMFSERGNVLLGNRGWIHPSLDGFISHYWEMDPIAVSMLNRLYEIHPFTTVLSSTWKEKHTKEQIVALFSVNNLNLHLHEEWKTPNIDDRYRNTRGSEIEMWLTHHVEKYKVEDYLILDDASSGEELADEYKLSKLKLDPKSVHIINLYEGIDYYTYQNMKARVNKWGKVCRPLW